MRGIPNRSTTARVRNALSATVVVCAVTLAAPTAATAAPPGPTVATGGFSVGVERISVATDEGYGAASITPDGRSIVFTSLKNGPAQGGNTVYVRDRQAGQTRTEPLSEGWTPAISGDGRQVAANAPRQGMTAERIQQHSLDLGLLPVTCGRCNQPSLSADGRHLAFGLLLHPPLNRHVVVADRNGGSETIAVLNTSAPARPSISGDGRYVAYQDLAYRTEGVYLWDRTTGTTSGPLEGASTSASLVQLSDDGSKVVYLSGSDTYVHDVASGHAQRVANVQGVAIDPTGRHLLYVPNGTGGPSLVLRDLQTGADETVSDQPATAEADSVSADGRDVVFQSAADGIVPGDTNGTSDVFVRRFS
ncbi:TolB family protein [Streptomyces sp. NPDC127068]|uniref:TolB family protein n=1 Tax=Streptomyces sp. NPDC127068 TaxID=3347127 RepID=UPI0036566D3A